MITSGLNNSIKRRVYRLECFCVSRYSPASYPYRYFLDLLYAGYTDNYSPYQKISVYIHISSSIDMCPCRGILIVIGRCVIIDLVLLHDVGKQFFPTREPNLVLRV